MPDVLVSVIIASRHRPAALDLCLRALRLQDHARLEIVVVADPDGLAAATATGILHKAIAFDQANLSTARNLGIAAASGQVLAFIDDDAVAEPSWAGRLAGALAAPGVVAVTGPVRGMNGISLQWGLTHVDAMGLDQSGAAAGGVIKLLGTNMAFRADALRAIGGFDPAFRFYLDDADVSRRIGAMGQSVFVPGAVVQHGFAPSSRRRVDRVPLSLTDIGRSSAIFLRRHGAERDRDALHVRLWTDQSTRLSHHVAAGRITASQGHILMDGLDLGWQEGWSIDLPVLAPLSDATAVAVICPDTRPRQGAVLSGRIWSRARLMTEAAERSRQGQVVTVICLSPSPRAHRHRFDPKGFWIQTGGLFGWSDRNGPRMVFRRFATRIREEALRLSKTRPVGG